MRLIERLENAGLKVSLLGSDQIEVRPKSLITEELRQLIRENKPRLMDWLRGGTVRPPGLSENLFNASLELDALIEAQDILRGYRLKKAPEPEPEIEPTQVEPPPPGPPAVKHVDADWHSTAVAYHQHHFGCPTCGAAGQGRGERCKTGSALWTTYQSNFEGQNT